MLTTAGSSQYLHPDYIQPLPTTLDAKKSPLALLAQTCSSIGKDSPSSSAKSLIPPIERKDAPKDRSSSRSKSASPGSKTSPAPDRNASQPSRADSNASPPRSTSSVTSQASSSPSGFKPPSTSPSKSPHAKIDSSTTTTSVTQQPTPASMSSSQTNSRISINCGNMMLEVNHESKAASSAGTHLPGTLRPDLVPSHMPHLPHHLAAAYPGMHLPLGLGYPFDPAASAYAAALSGAAAGHAGLLKPGALPSSSSALSSYLNYARMKSPYAGSSHCKDPYCGGHCQSSTSCSAGCIHEKPPATSLPQGTLPFYPGALGASPSSLHALSSLYAAGHPYGAMLPGAAQGLSPFVCNWVGGSEYCGKRFSSSEELLQHLRTHSSDASALAAAALPYAHLGLPPYVLPNSGSLSPNSALRSSLGRSLSPSSLVAASRFHPYKSPLSSLSVPPGTPGARLPMSLPSPLAAHYPSYWADAQRLGAAVTP
ncbi:hypothetical protein CAPTEDRAFT_225552 [Capitella teleta]|uniref:C2H2-type domain-containing protein n=1 Tax=Capitella teleta TaxID=283909 RepID=R7U9X9_CAPTE|nr:hypothetical protein CAPTEDRAFT_225552 [Capitella teleta]|eukprot:ELT99925.1 hypothetical protein CAPTEDRAFT_225552 [Capitella teleta]